MSQNLSPEEILDEQTAEDENLTNAADTDDGNTGEEISDDTEDKSKENLEQEKLKEILKLEQDAQKEKELEESKKLSRFQRMQQKHEAQLQEAQREIEFLRKLAVSQGSIANQGSVSNNALNADDNEEPQIENFTDITEFIKARDSFLEKKLISTVEKRARATIEQERLQAAMQQKLTKAKEVLTDWDEVMQEDDDEVIPLSDTVSFIVESDVGPFIAHALKKDPDLHDRLNRLSPVRRIAELTRLEDKILEKKQEPVVTKKITQAPAKLSEAKGKGLSPTGDAAAAAAARTSYAAWKAAHHARQKSKNK